MTKDEMKMTFTQKITREEMKDKISMALKDPILQQGFEIICKNLVELERENAELKKINSETLTQLNLDNGELIIENEKLRKENAELKEHIKADCIDCADYIKNKKLEKENEELRNNGFTVSAMTEQQLKVAIEKGKQLEKENAELKEENLENESEAREVNIRFDKLLKKYILQKDQLTKAKEIIKEFARLEYADYTDGDYSNELSKVLEQAEQFLKEIEK